MVFGYRKKHFCRWQTVLGFQKNAQFKRNQLFSPKNWESNEELTLQYLPRDVARMSLSVKRKEAHFVFEIKRCFTCRRTRYRKFALCFSGTLSYALIRNRKSCAQSGCLQPYNLQEGSSKGQNSFFSCRACGGCSESVIIYFQPVLHTLCLFTFRGTMPLFV